jgi:hypothetical protein
MVREENTRHLREGTERMCYGLLRSLPLSLTVSTGTTIPYQNITWDAIDDTLGLSFSGVVSESDYQQMMSSNPLQVPTPTVFAGYNIDGNGMVFWSSPPLTYAAGMLALGKCALLTGQKMTMDQSPTAADAQPHSGIETW